MIANSSLTPIAGMILAGGKSQRFNYQDKSWASYGEHPLIKQVIDQATPQVEQLCINTNSPDHSRFTPFNLPIIEDTDYPNQGPLSGILRGLQWAKSIGINWLVSFPVDTPNIPNDLVKKLDEKRILTSYRRIIARDHNYEQHVLGLWSVALIDSIKQGLQQGHNKLSHCLENEPYDTVLFANNFLNINTPDYLASLTNPSKP